MVINLHGKLAKEIGRERWNLKVSSVSEAMRGIDANTDNMLSNYLIDSHNKNISYQVIVDGENCTNPSELGMEGNVKEVDIIPHVEAADGVEDIIKGIIIAVTIYYAWPYLASQGGNAAAYWAGETAASTFFLYVGQALLYTGVAMALGGIYQSIVGIPDADELEQTESKGSFLFSGPVNQTRQGNPVPVAYGEVICGSQVLDVSVKNKNYTGKTSFDGTPASQRNRGDLGLVNLNINQWGYDSSSDTTLFPVSSDAQPVRSHNVIDPNLEIVP